MKLSNNPHALKVTAGLVLAGLVLFGSSFNDPFHFDDSLITNDSNVTNSVRALHFLNPFHLRQLTFFTFYLNHLAGGADPAGYHVVNVIVHVANAILLFCLLSRYLDTWIAIAASAIFLVHPIQTEPVLYVYERSTLLACCFSFLGLIAMAERKNWLALGMFFLAFESKETALAVPLAVILLKGVWGRGLEGRLQDQTANSLNAAIKPAAAYLSLTLSLAAGALLVLFYRNEQTVGIRTPVSPFRYLLTETRVVFTYLRLLVLPYAQSIEYDFPGSGGVLTIAGILSILAAGWWLMLRQNWKIPGLCIFAFFLLLAPTSSIIPSADAAFEHRLYLPMIAFSILAAFLLAKLPGRTWITACLIVVLSALTMNRGLVWSTDVALWEDASKHAPGKARVWFNLGGAYLNSDPAKAKAALERALEIQPHFPEALYDLGVIEQGKGNWNSALSYYGRAIEQAPDYWPAWNNMGNTLFAIGEKERSLACFEKTLSLNADYWPAQYNIAIVHFMSGRYAEALPRLKTVLNWRPEFREARYLLAMSLSRTGDRNASGEEWKRLNEMNAAESRNTPTMILAPGRP